MGKDRDGRHMRWVSVDGPGRLSGRHQRSRQGWHMRAASKSKSKAGVMKAKGTLEHGIEDEHQHRDEDQHDEEEEDDECDQWLVVSVMTSNTTVSHMQRGNKGKDVGRRASAVCLRRTHLVSCWTPCAWTWTYLRSLGLTRVLLQSWNPLTCHIPANIHVVAMLLLPSLFRYDVVKLDDDLYTN